MIILVMPVLHIFLQYAAVNSIVGYGTLAACGVLFSEGFFFFVASTARLSEDARRFVDK